MIKETHHLNEEYRQLTGTLFYLLSPFYTYSAAIRNAKIMAGFQQLFLSHMRKVKRTTKFSASE